MLTIIIGVGVGIALAPLAATAFGTTAKIAWKILPLVAVLFFPYSAYVVYTEVADAVTTWIVYDLAATPSI